MSAEHKRPLYAFAAVMVVCLLIIAHAVHSQALTRFGSPLPPAVVAIGPQPVEAPAVSPATRGVDAAADVPAPGPVLGSGTRLTSSVAVAAGPGGQLGSLVLPGKALPKVRGKAHESVQVPPRGKGHATGKARGKGHATGKARGKGHATGKARGKGHATGKPRGHGRGIGHGNARGCAAVSPARSPRPASRRR